MIELNGKIDPVKELQGKINAVPGGVYGSSDSMTYILVTEDGQEIPAVVVEEETVFTATANDIRAGTVAATAEGVTEGTKVIPCFHTWEGAKVITAGSQFSVQIVASDGYDFTKLQVIICPVSGGLDGSVAAEAVVINEGVYPVNSTEKIATVTKDSEKKAINLGITNESTSLYLMRYFTYKEIL